MNGQGELVNACWAWVQVSDFYHNYDNHCYYYSYYHYHHCYTAPSYFTFYFIYDYFYLFYEALTDLTIRFNLIFFVCSYSCVRVCVRTGNEDEMV